MGREPADRVDSGPHRDVIAENAHALVAVHEPPAEGARSLVADDHDRARRPAEVVAQVVSDSPRVTHAAGRDDDGARLDAIERDRLFDGARETRIGPLGMALPQRQQRACFIVQELLSFQVIAVSLSAIGESTKTFNRGSRPCRHRSTNRCSSSTYDPTQTPE